MSNPQPLLFQVGQRAEMRSFIPGFRGAWFRCELKDVKDVAWSKGQMKYQVQYYDYDDGLEWVKLYEVPRRSKGGTKRKRELMLRPEYPSIYHESELSDMNVISDVAVVVDGSWNVGDLVDWMKDGCFWSGKITKVLGDNTIEVKLPRKPVGEGLIYIVSCKDLRPSLNWSPDSGWAFPAAMESHNRHPHVRLIQPVKQAPISESLVNVVVEENRNVGAMPRSSLEFNYSISSHNSGSSLPLLSRLMRSKGSLKQKEDMSEKDREQTRKENLELDKQDSSFRNPSCSDSVSSTNIGDASTEVPVANDAEKKDLENESVKKMRLFESIPLNSTSCDSIESAIIDLEELVCRVQWLKQILKPDSPSISMDKNWEFVEHHVDSKPK